MGRQASPYRRAQAPILEAGENMKTCKVCGRFGPKYRWCLACLRWFKLPEAKATVSELAVELGAKRAIAYERKRTSARLHRKWHMPYESGRLPMATIR
jgi:hypothetical protein